MTEAPHTLDARRRRILYRATHRGTAEADFLVGDFVAARIAAMDEAALAVLEVLLTLPDPDLADWISGRRAIPPEHDGVVLRAMRDTAGR